MWQNYNLRDEKNLFFSFPRSLPAGRQGGNLRFSEQNYDSSHRGNDKRECLGSFLISSFPFRPI